MIIQKFQTGVRGVRQAANAKGKLLVANALIVFILFSIWKLYHNKNTLIALRDTPVTTHWMTKGHKWSSYLIIKIIYFNSKWHVERQAGLSLDMPF